MKTRELIAALEASPEIIPGIVSGRKAVEKAGRKGWERTAEHEEYGHYSVFIMFRHLLIHEMLHAYRIEGLMLRRDRA